MHFFASCAAEGVTSSAQCSHAADMRALGPSAKKRTNPVLMQHKHVEPLLFGLLRAQPLDLFVLLPCLEQALVADIPEAVCAATAHKVVGRQCMIQGQQCGSEGAARV